MVQWEEGGKEGGTKGEIKGGERSKDGAKKRGKNGGKDGGEEGGGGRKTGERRVSFQRETSMLNMTARKWHCEMNMKRRSQ